MPKLLQQFNYVSLINEVLHEVLNKKIAVTLRLKLESLYMTKSLTNKLYLKHQLYMLCMSEGKFIKSHLDKFNLIITNLWLINVKIKEKDAEGRKTDADSDMMQIA